MAVPRWVAPACLAAVGLAAASAAAHHASAPFYDDTRSVEARGVVTRFEFKNPHSFLYLEGTTDDGSTVNWEIEMGPAVSMSRRGWTPDTINAGDEILAVGRPSRAPGTWGMCCAELTRPDGSPISPAQ
ncbi:MAG: hypothetical protein F4057_04095 [Acidobacteria bacterium]|nr:hypothetical protein [Acidobacteriota bacterium]MYI74512.1 hypothetical protein [Acidobacteriota bacterium]